MKSTSHLIGREEETFEIQTLLQNLKSTKSRALILEGKSGTGKTELINAKINHLLGKNDLFVYAKFEESQYLNDSENPYSVIKDSLEWLVTSLFVEPKGLIEDSTKRLKKLYMNKHNFVSHFAPTLNKILGVNDVYEVVDYYKNKTKMYADILELILFFVQRKNKLVFFIDDIQWADDYSIELLNYLVYALKDQPILFIVAYRKSELMNNAEGLRFSSILRTSNRSIRLKIKEFDEVSVKSYVTAHLPELRVEDINILTKIILKKTFGNILYISQFVSRIIDEGFIDCNEDNELAIDIHRINTIEMTDDVVDFIVKNIENLDKDLIELLKVASSMTRFFNLMNMTAYFGKDISEELNRLETKGFIIRTGKGEDYKFVHDKILLGVTKLVSTNEKDIIYKNIAYLLVKAYSEDIDDYILTMIYYIDYANLDGFFKEELCGYYYKAARMARYQATYDIALKYLRKAINLLDESCWINNYQGTYDIYYDSIQCEFVKGSLDTAKDNYQILLEYVKKRDQKAEVYSLMSVLWASRGNYPKAVEEGIRSVKCLGIKLKKETSQFSLAMEAFKVSYYFRKSRLKSLVDLEELQDETVIREIEELGKLCPAANITNENLYSMILLKIALLSSKYGSNQYAGISYVSYGIVAAHIFHDYIKAEKLMEIAFEIDKRYEDEDCKCLLTFVVGTFISHWTNPLSKSIEYLEKSKIHAINAGNHLFIGYTLSLILEGRYLSGENLQGLYAICEEFEKYGSEMNFKLVLIGICMNKAMVESLMGTTDVSIVNHPDLVALMNSEPDGDVVSYCLLRCQYYYLVNDYINARIAMERGLASIDLHMGFATVFDYHLFHSLIITMANNQEISFKDKLILKRNMNKMKKWMSYSLDNCAHKYYIMKAEYLRITSKNYDSKTIETILHYYDLGSAMANKSGYTQMAAIAQELASKFLNGIHELLGESSYLNRSKNYEELAYKYYQRWGAFIKCKDSHFKYKENTNKELEIVSDNKLVKQLMIPAEDNFNKRASDINLCLLHVLKSLESDNLSPEKVLELYKGIKEVYSISEWFLVRIDKDDVFISSTLNLAESIVEFSNIEVYKREIIRYTIRAEEIVLINIGKNKNIPYFDSAFKDIKQPTLCIPMITDNGIENVFYIEGEFELELTDSEIDCLKFLLHKIYTYTQKIDELNKSEETSEEVFDVSIITKREKEVLELLRKGLTNIEISEKLELTVSTIKTHTKNLYNKLEVNTRQKAVVKATEYGVFE